MVNRKGTLTRRLMSQEGCQHNRPIKLADSGSTSAGRIHWCPDCGALCVDEGNHVGPPIRWRLPGTKEALE